MKFTKELLKHIAKLGKIELSDGDIDKFTPQMQTILDSVKTLEEVDTSKVVVTSLKRVNFDELREDVSEESQSIDDALKNVKYKEGRYVKVMGTTFGTEES